MRRLATLLLVPVLFVVLAAQALPGLALAAPRERRVALVIGNGAYKTGPLKNPANDARDMAATLKSLGFEVLLRENATQRQMNDAIDQFWQSLKKGGVGLFFFAGHGLQVAGENYLVPVDAKVNLEKDVQYECVNAGKVLGRMEDAGNGLNIVILDACRNNPFARSFRSESRGLVKMDAPTGSLVAFATAPGDVAADGEGKNGLYTSHLLRVLRTPGLKIEDVLKRVRIGVAQDSAKAGKRQTPWESSSLMGDFYFVGGGQAGAAPQELASLPPLVHPVPAQPFVQKPIKLNTPLALVEPQKPQRAWLGVKLADVDPGPVDVKPGTAVLVEGVYAGSPAEAAGLRAGDMLFTPGGDAMNAQSFWERLSHAEPEGVLRLNRWREGKARGVVITLAAPPATPPVLVQSVPTASSPGASSGPKPGDTWTDPVTGMEFLWVPGGTYEMGCGPWVRECFSNERPAHAVRVAGFWLGKYEVTQGQWESLGGGNPSAIKGGDDYPVDNVSWNDAKAFIGRLNRAGAAKFRLPTEAEWEYAARSGGKAENYAGGEDLDRVAWHKGNSGATAHPVGAKAANGLGLHDMSGNVGEWCEEACSAEAVYSCRSQDRPSMLDGTDMAPPRVVRGGSWLSMPREARTTGRYGLAAGRQLHFVGLRLVRVP